MSLLLLPRRPFALCLCAPLALACGLALAPAWAQEAPSVATDAPRRSDAQSERAFWSEQEELSEAERAVLEHNVAVLSKRGYNKWGEKLWSALRAQEVPGSGRSAGELELSEPALAVAFYGDWLSHNTDVAPRSLELRVRVSSLVAQLLARDLGDARKALAVYDWSLATLQVGSDANWQRLAVERDALVLSQRGQGRGAKAVGLDAAATQWASASLSAVGGVKLDSSDAVQASGVRVARLVPDAVEAKVRVPSSVTPAAPVAVTMSEVKVTEQANSPTVSPAATRMAPVAVRARADVAKALEAVSATSVSATGADVYAAVPGLIAVPEVKMTERANSGAPIVNPFATAGAFTFTFTSAFGAVALAPSTVAVSGAADVTTAAVTPDVGSFVARTTEAATASPVAFNQSNARRDAALSQIRAGGITPEAAWQSGALNYGNVVDYFQNSTGAWIVHQRETDGGLHHRLLALLLTHEADRLQTPASVPVGLRLWLADYYQSRGDERCLRWAESVLSESRGPDESQNPLMFSAVERIAWFYGDRGQHQQCAQTWLRLSDYCGGKGWWQADMWIMAARSLEQIGQNSKARELRARVPSVGDGWLSGLARYDEAQNLMNQSQHESARRLLQLPLEGTGAPNARVGLLSLLAESYLQTGEFERAESAAQSALKTYRQLKQAPSGAGFKFQVERARQIAASSKEHRASASAAPFAYQAPP